MKKEYVKKVLAEVAAGTMDTEEAFLRLKEEPFKDLGFAKLDTQRELRQGVAEVVYGAGKSAEQIIKICEEMLALSQERIMITKLNAASAEQIRKKIPLTYFSQAEIGLIGDMPEAETTGTVLVATGGTSDCKVAEEAALTASVLGNRVERLYDVGVAGLHRLLANTDKIMSARVIIAIAGMEGALASVIAGMADCPVIAVPTSVGYGASFGGVAALLSMLNSCASGVSVVNIDNGFGAGYLASMINHIGGKNN